VASALLVASVPAILRAISCASPRCARRA